MDVSEFVNSVIPTVGARCGDGTCGEWADHTCVRRELRSCVTSGRCLTHCICADETEDE